MNKLRTLVYTVLDGVENRVDTFIVKVEHIFSSTVEEVIEIGRQAVQHGIGVVFGLIEMVVAESFGLVGAVVELVIGKRDVPGLPAGDLVMSGDYGVFELDDGGQTPIEVNEEDN